LDAPQKHWSRNLQRPTPGSEYMTASLHRKRLAHDSFGAGEVWLRGVFD